MKLRYLPDVVTLTYDPAKCKGCGRCAEVCPHAVFSMADKRAVLSDREACIECGACKKNCPFDAIDVTAGVGCAAAILSSKKKKNVTCGDNGPCCG